MTDRLYDNLAIWNPAPEDCVGPFSIPVIAGVASIPDVEAWLPINDMGKFSPRVACQLYGYDYQLARLWNDPERYIPILGRAACTLAPDFSLYADTPMALQLHNHYKKHWLAALWQRHGLTVYPTICWGDESAFDFCFDGEPTRSVVSVSSVGTQRSGDTKAAFLKGYDAMLERLEPSAVLFFGNIPKEARGNIVPVAAFQEQVRGRVKMEVDQRKTRGGNACIDAPKPTAGLAPDAGRRMRADLQLFGGRGGTVGAAGGKGRPAAAKHTAASLKGLSRRSLLKLARPIFMRNNAALGAAEARSRFNALTTGKGNSNAQLRKYILRNQ